MKKATKMSPLAFIAVLGLPWRQALAARAVDHVVVNAQYRGAGTKSFRGIGSGVMTYSGSPAAFTLRGNCQVTHPRERNRVYRMDIDASFRVSGNNIEIVHDASRFNAEAAPGKAIVLDALPFIYLARMLPPPGPNEEPSRTYQYRGQSFVLRYHRTEKQYEADLYCGDEHIGKFFLTSDWRPGNEGLEKFRIPIWSENVVVSFVVE